MTKSTKRLLTMLPYSDKNQRDAFKHAMIDAHITGNIVPKTVKDKTLKGVEAD